jgi:hypothetical protein
LPPADSSDLTDGAVQSIARNCELSILNHLPCLCVLLRLPSFLSISLFREPKSQSVLRKLHSRLSRPLINEKLTIRASAYPSRKKQWLTGPMVDVDLPTEAHSVTLRDQALAAAAVGESPCQ